ncbi:MAG: anaerobic ribonucleoside-triphosphate reductase activating protein [Corallococcus sp.]|nr:anaerobic ribonucleoside-triphosphate reductase activating protein [Corallococcus sp.]MCM1359933.1 anaerobic ribonucleoside-triphosphate reductase activating protein [Corallococcus sp.]MCM1395489.1 anaerobic ribonucleoside-triphosphate reductase activating protein [Corallococcus sp.]
MKFGGLAKLTLLDYPEKVACTVFTAGCNFRCPFCHNAGLVGGTNCENLSQEEIFDFLKKRKSVLEGMCLTGGEPLLQQGVEDFLRKVKSLGYSVKLDTNGSFPNRLRNLICEGLVDYVAMDVKNSKERYSETAGCGNLDIDAVCRSVELLKSGVVNYEFRTTVTGNYHTEESMEQMGVWLQGASKLYLQKFVDSGDLIDGNTVGCSDETMREYRRILKKYVPNTYLRGIED